MTGAHWCCDQQQTAAAVAFFELIRGAVRGAVFRVVCVFRDSRIGSQFLPNPSVSERSGVLPSSADSSTSHFVGAESADFSGRSSDDSSL